MRTSVQYAGEPFDRICDQHERIAKCLKMAVKQEVVLTEKGVICGGWPWDDEAFAERVERGCKLRLVESKSSCLPYLGAEIGGDRGNGVNEEGLALAGK